jgi:hypothetical protein
MNKIIWYIILILVLVFIFYQKETFTNTTSNLNLKNKIIYGLKTIDEIFNKHSIYYTAAYGTLLGAVRHRDMIPWDDDADINVMRKDYEKIMSLKGEFKKKGLILDSDWKLMKIYFDDSKYPFIDLFINDEIDGKLVRCAEPYEKTCTLLDRQNEWWWKWLEYPMDWIKNRKRFKFGEIEIWGPSSAEKVLKYWYGPNCLIECKSPEYEHTTGTYVKSENLSCGDLPEPQL